MISHWCAGTRAHPRPRFSDSPKSSIFWNLMPSPCGSVSQFGEAHYRSSIRACWLCEAIMQPHLLTNGRNPFSWRFYYKSILSILCPCALSFAVLQPICSSASKSDYTFHEKDECAFQLVSIRCPANLSPVCFMSPSPGYQHTYTHAQA